MRETDNSNTPLPGDPDQTFKADRVSREKTVRIFIHESVDSYRAFTRDLSLQKDLLSLSFHDQLTGLFNRRYFETEMRRLDTRRQLPLSVVMGDINGLKLVNDAFGYQKGDHLLMSFSGILRESCRQEDVIARWGGDEFTILLPQTPEEKGKEICSRILERCLQKRWKPIPISASLGLATKIHPNQVLASVLQQAEEKMFHEKTLKSSTVRRIFLEALKYQLFEIHQETWHNSEGKILELHLALGKSFQLSKRQLEELLKLAMLHDIGKIALPREVLIKPGFLTPAEWDIVKKHPEIGFRIVQYFPDLAPLADSILSYRERWDGTGYPLGISGGKIAYLARLSNIINAFLAMTHNRPHQRAKSTAQAIREIEASAGQKFDPSIVTQFLKIVSESK
ncbi:MAG TPA: diguanylate cyclase [Atribacteraceae bacterium]|nr:diguanylate cyclase [Atribacteraceae bacterium]